MANLTTGARLWTLTDVAVIVAKGTRVIVRKVVFIPTAIDDDVTIQEYDSSGVARDAIVLKASHLDIGPVSLDFGSSGRRLNGFSLSVIDHGILYVYLGRN